MKKLLARLWLAATGWSVEAERPSSERFVLIAAPHTSGWDLPYMLAATWSIDLSPAWIGKHTLFGPLTGWLFRLLGGIRVDRRSRHDVVQQIVEVFGQSDRLHLVIAPEGTRRRAEHWKSGFDWMAHKAGVPIALGFLDYGRKVAGIGPGFETTGDPIADMETIRGFYAGMSGRYPDRSGPIRLREEAQALPDRTSLTP